MTNFRKVSTLFVTSSLLFSCLTSCGNLSADSPTDMHSVASIEASAQASTDMSVEPSTGMSIEPSTGMSA